LHAQLPTGRRCLGQVQILEQPSTQCLDLVDLWGYNGQESQTSECSESHGSHYQHAPAQNIVKNICFITIIFFKSFNRRYLILKLSTTKELFKQELTLTFEI